MSNSKIERMNQIRSMENVFEWTDYNSAHPFPTGSWNSEIFGNELPIFLELACGKGEYTIGLAGINDAANFVGVDIKGNRIWVGAKKGEAQHPGRVRFLRAYIDHLDQFFAANEISGIWIIFPDPQLRKNRKKLTSPKFLDIYRQIMKKDARVHLKTDSPELYEYTRRVIREQSLTLHADIPDIYKLDERPPELDIVTYYERQHLKNGRTIRYLSFSL